MKSHLFSLVLCLATVPLLAQDADWVRDWEAAQRERPQNLSSHSRIAPKGEPGERLIVHGRVFKPDGVTPVAGAVVFAYQTDGKGLYHEPGKPGWRLQGWAVTDKEGAFEFATIRPGPYPGRKVPAHIHLTVEGSGVPRQWTEELRFADDPLISESDRKRATAKGIFGSVRPVSHEGKTERIDFNIRTKRDADF